MRPKNCLVVLGPTASGKTVLGVRLAEHLGGEILSADSRQVYRRLDIGSGKDLAEYRTRRGEPIPYHLIDRIDPEEEYSLFDYQKDFYEAFRSVAGRGKVPVVVGGTGLYLESVLQAYEMVPVAADPDRRKELETLTLEELRERLKRSKRPLHNTTDLRSRDRLIRAIEIAESTGTPPSRNAPDIRPLVLGVSWERGELRRRIGERLKVRLQQGLIEEVRELHREGLTWERLESLGLEYRYVADYLQGRIPTENDLFQKLHSAINRFSKRQMTWFRRMQRRGTDIRWIDRADEKAALREIEKVEWTGDS